jgi:hypothetical protein
MFHRMESCGLKGTWCQRYDRLKMWKSTIFSNINYTLGDVTVLESFFFFFFGSIKVWTQASHLLGSCSTTWPTPPALFCKGFFQNRVSRTICQGWFPSKIFLISASQVVRITGVSLQRPAL